MHLLQSTGLLVSLFTLVVYSCERHITSPWAYVCGEQADFAERNGCEFRLRDKAHLIAIIPEEDAWKIYIAHDGPGHASAELTVTAKDEPIELRASRKEGTCTSNYCTFELTGETLDRIMDADTFVLAVKRVLVAKHNVRHINSTEEFSLKGLQNLVKKAEQGTGA